MVMIGPNTMGICNPHIDFFCTGTAVRPLAGSTAVVAQSGNMGTQLLAFAEQQNIGIRAFSGSGTEAMLTIEDYLEGFEVDPEEARALLAEFLNRSLRRGLRCVRIIHGKGLRSPNREPVLKGKVAGWLMQRQEILAFCQARRADGGGGAVLVLLKGGG